MLLTGGCATLLAGAAALIQAAKQLGLPVGVASSGAPAKIQHNLTSSGLKPLLPTERFIVSASEVGAGKPAPDVYLEVLKRMGCADASRALVVEDAVHGLVAAKGAGKRWARILHCAEGGGSLGLNVLLLGCVLQIPNLPMSDC